MNMRTKTGIWIDRHKAIIVTIIGRASSVSRVFSDIDTRPRIEGETFKPVSDQTRDERRKHQTSKFFETVISSICRADEVLVFGPGETKGELLKVLSMSKSKGPRLVGVEKASKMTDNQLVARVKERFSQASARSAP